MHFDILITIFFTSIIQSIFGTGVLLFGTPLLLLYGYNFQFSLSILLPTSILINLFQLRNKFNDIEIQFYKKLVVWSIPFIIFFLYFISFISINLNPIIGVLLILISLKGVIPLVNKNTIIKYEAIYLVITGIIHGITNLGGALLSAIVISKNLSKKQTRATIAICYLTFAVFQIITLNIFIIDNGFINIINCFYWILGLTVFFIVEKFLYIKIDEITYSKYFSLFLLLIGLLLLVKY